MPDQGTRNWARATEVVGVVVVVLSALALIGPVVYAVDDLTHDYREADGLGVLLAIVVAIPCVACLLLGIVGVRSIRRSRRLDLRRPLIAAPILLLLSVAVLAFIVSGYLGFFAALPVVQALGQIGPLLAGLLAAISPVMLLASGQDGSGRATSGPGTMSA